MIKFEIIDDVNGDKSWGSIDEKYGRVRAFQVAENWPLNRGRRLENLDSIADLYLDTSYDTTGETVQPDQLLSIEDCGMPHHLSSLDPVRK